MLLELNMVSDEIKELLFTKARTHFKWLDKPVSDELLYSLYNLFKWAPTSANSNPIRIKFIKSSASKERLRPYLMGGNVDKTIAAPVTAIIGYDVNFYHNLHKLFAHDKNIHQVFAATENQNRTEKVAFLNGSLQGGYFIMAARLLGLDCGPMSGFDAAGVDNEFWSGTSVKTNFLCNLGYGDSSVLFPRLPRLEFDEVCSII